MLCRIDVAIHVTSDAYLTVTEEKEGANMHRFMIPRVAHCSDGCKPKS